jgi:plastocyanin
MTRPNRHKLLRPLTALAVATLALAAACGGGGYGSSATSTPKANSAAPSPAASSAANGQGASLEISTPSGTQYDKNELDATTGQQITVKYTNNSTTPHNVHFNNGPDANSPSLGQTNIAAGPNNVQTVSFKAPSTPGSYYFHCDVHPTVMNGHLVVR